MNKATILGPDGEALTAEHVSISYEDAKLLRDYKRFLQRHQLKEALYCQSCWEGERADGCEAHVTGDRVLIRCRCKIRTYLGLSV